MTSPASPTYGPALVGVAISLVLYGIILCQAFTYYRSYPSDTVRIKAIVGFLVFTDTIHSLFSIILIYEVLVGHYDDPTYLLESNWLLNAYPAFVGIISASVQMFFAMRVKVLTGNIWLFGFICMLCFGELCTGIAISVKSGESFLVVMTPDLKKMVPVWLVFSMVAEICLTSVLTWYLRKPTALMGPTQDIVRRIARVTLSNGMLTTLWTLGDVICYLVGGGQIHLIFCYPLAKLYIISMLSTLHIRPTTKERQTRSELPTIMTGTNLGPKTSVLYRTTRPLSTCDITDRSSMDLDEKSVLKTPESHMFEHRINIKEEEEEEN